MAEIIERISRKLDEFNTHTEDLLLLVGELEKIKRDSSQIKAEIEGKFIEAEKCRKIILDLKQKAEETMGSILSTVTSVATDMNKSEERLKSLNLGIENLQEKTDRFFQEIAGDVDGFKEGAKKEIDTRIEAGLKNLKQYVEGTQASLSDGISSFLKKQNLLITNLAQQIDSCLRAVDSFKVGLEGNTRAVEAVKDEVRTLTDSIEAVRKEGNTLKDELRTVRESQGQLGKEIVGIRAANELVKNDLKQIREKLEGTEFVKKLGIGWVLIRKKSTVNFAQ